MSKRAKAGLLTRNTAIRKESPDPAKSRAILLAGAAALACCQALTAHALELGELQIKSRIGQPLLVTAAARISRGESLTAGCITSTTPDSSMGGISNLKVQVPQTSTPGTYLIKIVSNQALQEPMYEIRLQVNCAGSLSFTQDYAVMLNLSSSGPGQLSAAVKTPARAPQAPEARIAATANTNQATTQTAAAMTPHVLPLTHDTETRAMSAPISNRLSTEVLAGAAIKSSGSALKEPLLATQALEKPVAATLQTSVINTPASMNNTVASSNRVHPLLAASIGALLGCLIAGLLLGRRIVGVILPKPVECDPLEAIAELEQCSAETPARDIDFQSIASDVNAAAGKAEDHAKPTVPAMNLDIDGDLSEHEHLSAAVASEAPAASERSDIAEQPFTETTDHHRHQNTTAELSNASSELSALNDLDVQQDMEPTAGLQTTAETGYDGAADDKLSQTLTQALDLLDKDYEEEFGSSQTLEQKEVHAAFDTVNKT